MTHKIVIHANAVDWQREYLPRFTAGFVEHGCRVIHTQIDEPDEEAINVIFANNSWKRTQLICNRKNVPLITVGRCFFGSRFDMVAIGWDGFNGAADFCLTDEMPDDRWQKHGWELTSDILAGVNGDPDGYILVCGEFRPMDQWYATLREMLAGNEVRFRPHPFKANQVVPGWKLAPHAGQDALSSLFPDVRCLVTYDSIAGCDGVLAGLPTVVWGEAGMARPVAYHSLKQFFDDGCMTPRGDVQAWANKLAYCQWSHDEIATGDFWTHLKSRIG